MKLNYFFLLLLLCFYNYSFACDCKSIDQENMVETGLKLSEIVFYGEVIKVDPINRSYTFRIIELFKGKYNSQFITHKYSGNCSIIPSLKQLWIVYAEFNDDKTIELSSCSPSIGFKPNWISFVPPPPPIKTFSKTDDEIKILSDAIWELKLENQNLINWIYQLERLRMYKSLENKNSEKDKKIEKIETYNQYIIISLIVNIVLFLSLILVILKKKNFAK